MLKSSVFGCWVWLLAFAAQSDALFSVDVFERDAERAAVSQVLTRLTGRPAAQVEADFADILVAPDEWVAALSAGDLSSEVQVSTALSRALRERSVPVWRQPRPPRLLWLAVDDGNGRRAVDGRGTDPLTVALRRASDYWALPLAYPFWDEEDRRQITPAELWGLFLTSVPEASERYGSTYVAGRVRLTGLSWEVNLADESGRRLRAEYDDLETLADALMAWLSEPLVAEFGLVGEQRVTLRTSFADGEDYLNWVSRVRALPGVDRIWSSAQSGGFATLEVDTGLRAQGLLRLLTSERLLLSGTVTDEAIVGTRQ